MLDAVNHHWKLYKVKKTLEEAVHSIELISARALPLEEGKAARNLGRWQQVEVD